MPEPTQSQPTQSQPSLPQASLPQARTDHPIASVDLPQQDSLAKVRAVVVGLASGINKAGLGEVASLSPRHVRYTLHAARTLGFVSQSGDVWATTDRGMGLLSMNAGTDAEHDYFVLAVRHCAALKALVPELLEGKAPELDVLARRMVDRSGLSLSTAQRRAITLLAWREQLVPEVVAEAPAPVRVEPARPKRAAAQLDLFG